MSHPRFPIYVTFSKRFYWRLSIDVLNGKIKIEFSYDRSRFSVLLSPSPSGQIGPYIIFNQLISRHMLSIYFSFSSSTSDRQYVRTVNFVHVSIMRERKFLANKQDIYNRIQQLSVFIVSAIVLIYVQIKLFT